VWEFYALRFALLTEAEPNAGHRAIPSSRARGSSRCSPAAVPRLRRGVEAYDARAAVSVDGGAGAVLSTVAELLRTDARPA
jgi:hypothetical protein